MHTIDITISWIEPEYPNGVIQNYSVTVYQTSNISSVVYTGDSVTDSNITETVNVLPYTDYTVSVAASTSAGQGEKDSIIERSPQAGKIDSLSMAVAYVCICTYLYALHISCCRHNPLSCMFFNAVPGKVENLEASFNLTGADFNSETRMYSLNVDVEWNEPTFTNGVIDKYSVTIYRTENTSDVVYSNASLVVSSVTELVSVLPYTNYTVSVAASTPAGQGDKVYEIILSPEAGIETNVVYCNYELLLYCI